MINLTQSLQVTAQACDTSGRRRILAAAMLLCFLTDVFTGCAKPYPSTPVTLIQEFWNAASARDYERLTHLCPGTTQEDFEEHFAQGHPSTDITIYRPQPHYRKRDVQVFPVMVYFPKYGNKLFEFALTEAEDGRLVIDRDNSTWTPLQYRPAVREPSVLMTPPPLDLPPMTDPGSEE